MPDHIAEAPEISVVIPCRSERENAAAIIAQLEPIDSSIGIERIKFPNTYGADFQPSVSQGPNRFQGA
jgi:hypothetical protein